MKIQELSKRTGLTEYTLRYYEKEGLVDHRHVNRDENNYRNYTDEVLERLKKKRENLTRFFIPRMECWNIEFP